MVVLDKGYAEIMVSFTGAGAFSAAAAGNIAINTTKRQRLPNDANDPLFFIEIPPLFFIVPALFHFP